MTDSQQLEKLLIATKNLSKTAEMKLLLAGLPIELVSLNDFPHVGTVIESGSSYAENAILKASSYGRETNTWALADDSGLEVDALDGAPGVFSARYAGANATDIDRIKLLLSELSDLKDSERTARFCCVAVVADSRGEVINIAEGTCEGTIALEARGKNGFGYDPVFVPKGYDLTFGELSNTEKDRISHRAIALGRTKQFLLGLLDHSSGHS